jgi:hypothetical protein
MPKARREHGLRAIEAARKMLAMQTVAGNDPRCGAAVNRVRGETISQGIAVIAVGRASIRPSATKPGSSARLRRSSMPSRSRRSARLQGSRSRVLAHPRRGKDAAQALGSVACARQSVAARSAWD